MSDQWDQFPDAHAQTAPKPQPTPAGMDPEVYRSTLEHLVNTGATDEQIGNFIKSAGFDPETQVMGLKAARDYRAQGGQGHIQVLPTVAPTISHAQDPWEQFPDADHPHGTLDTLGMGVRSIGRGLADIPDALAAGGQFLNPLNHILPNETDPRTGQPYAAPPMANMAVDKTADAVGLARPVTSGEHLADAVIRGASGGAVTGEMGAVPIIARAMSGAGAGGASELARQHDVGPVGQIAAGLAGGLAGGAPVAAAGRAVDAMAPVAERELSPTMQAFDRRAVPALPADVGGVGTQMATAATRSTLGGIPIHEAAQQSIEAARNARGRIAAMIGTPAADAYTAGEAAKRGAQGFLDSSQATAERLYNAIPIAPTRPAVLGNTKAALDDLTRGLESNPELSAIVSDPKIQRIADAIKGKTVEVPTGVVDANGQPITRTVQQGGQLSWNDLKDFRSYIGEKAGAQALQSDTPTAKLKALYGALSDDMKATAEAEGPKALSAFNRANNFYRARQQRISDVIEPILGKDGNQTAEQAFRTIQSWSGDKGSFVRTAQALRSMPEEEANTVRATIFDKLGNAAPGQQNAAGEVFSPSTFLTQWNKIPAKTKAVLFPGDQYQKDIGDLVTIAEAQKNAQKFANTSGTALSMHMAPAGIASTAAFFHNPLAGLASLGAQFGAGKLLANPAFARWLASSVKKPNAAAQLAHVNKLTNLAVRQPVIANDVLQLQERLAQAFAQYPQPLAAQPAEQGGGQ